MARERDIDQFFQYVGMGQAIFEKIADIFQ